MIRLSDIIISFLILVILWPILLVIILLLLVYQGRPVFYTQLRAGKEEKQFKLFKFRSMKNNSSGIDEKNLSLEAFSDEQLREMRDQFQTTKISDSRITPIGKFVRKYSIDELPQLFNVFIGDMSLVGPRPDLIVQKVDYHPEEWRSRCSVKPGIVGLAQLNGRSDLTKDKRIELDLKWVEIYGFSNYCRILSLTPFKFLKGAN